MPWPTIGDSAGRIYHYFEAQCFHVMFRDWEHEYMDPRCPDVWRSGGFLGKDRKRYGPLDPLVVQKGGREGDGVSNLIGEGPWIPNGEVIDACSQARLVRRREGGDLSSLSPRKREGMDMGILRTGACSTTLKIASDDKEVLR